MSKGIRSTLVALVAVVTIGVAGFGCQRVPEGETDTSQAESPPRKQTEHQQRKTNLEIQFADDFSQQYDPPDHFDLKRWTQLKKGQVRTEDGYCLLEIVPDPPPSPGDIFFGGLATNEPYLNPGLTGTNGVEITLADFTYEGDYPEIPKKSEGLMLIHAWSLTLGNWQGLVGGQPDQEKDRGVQLHFDLLPPDGLFLYLVRGLVPEDFDKYPRDGFGAPEAKGMSERELRVLHEEAINTGQPFITVPCLSLATRVYRTEQEINEILGRSRRYGLYLTDDANTVYWTLDGEVMDSIDITGYFSSSPESVREGAFLTVMGVGGFQRNTWRMDDLEIYTSP